MIDTRGRAFGPNRQRNRMAWMLIMVLASIPAMAANRSKQAVPASDPFAAYDAQLNTAATNVLDEVSSDATAPQMKSAAVASTAEEIAPVTDHPHRAGLARVEQLRPVIDPVLRAVGVPTELAAVVLVESGGQPAALSPKGARGLWQLMPDTARRYGLVVETDRDDRLDIVKSTRAAAEYLRDLYAQFHSWPLALAAYNAGEQTVQRAITATGVRDFSVASEALPRETRNYVPAVLNVAMAFGHPLGARKVAGQTSQQVVYAAAID